MDTNVPDRSDRRFAFRMPRMTRGRMLGVAACALGGAIAVNATLFQSERHPAPMFRTLARPNVAKVELPTPPLRSDIKDTGEKSAPRAEKAAALAAPSVDPVVRDIQTELAARGYYKGEADGRTGPATAKAIRDFQTDRRMGVDGQPSEGLLSEVRSSRENMKEELFDLVKRAHAPERGDKPALRKVEPVAAPKAAPTSGVPKVAAKSDAKPKVSAKAEVGTKPRAEKAPVQDRKKAEAKGQQHAKAAATPKDARQKAEPAKVVRKEAPTREAAKARPKTEAKASPAPAKAVAKVDAPKAAPRSRLEADSPLRPPANVAEIIARN